jgi:hypothetical protein
MFKSYKGLLGKWLLWEKFLVFMSNLNWIAKVYQKRHSSSKQILKHSNMFPSQDIVRTSLLRSYHALSIMSPHHLNPARNGVSWFWTKLLFVEHSFDWLGRQVFGCSHSCGDPHFLRVLSYLLDLFGSQLLQNSVVINFAATKTVACHTCGT